MCLLGVMKGYVPFEYTSRYLYIEAHRIFTLCFQRRSHAYADVCTAKLEFQSLQVRVRPFIGFFPVSPHPTECHTPNPPLHAIPRLQYSPICRHEHALSRMRQTLHITALPRPCDLCQILTRQPYPSRRLAYQLHVLQHRLIVPVLQA